MISLLANVGEMNRKWGGAMLGVPKAFYLDMDTHPDMDTPITKPLYVLPKNVFGLYQLCFISKAHTYSTL